MSPKSASTVIKGGLVVDQTGQRQVDVVVQDGTSLE